MRRWKPKRRKFDLSKYDPDPVLHRKYKWVMPGRRSPAAECVALDENVAWRMLESAVRVRRDADGVTNKHVESGWDLSQLTLKDLGRAEVRYNYWLGIWPENAPRVRRKRR